MDLVRSIISSHWVGLLLIFMCLSVSYASMAGSARLHLVGMAEFKESLLLRLGCLRSILGATEFQTQTRDWGLGLPDWRRVTYPCFLWLGVQSPGASWLSFALFSQVVYYHEGARWLLSGDKLRQR